MTDEMSRAKTLVIDSHKSSSNAPAQNMHWLNARRIADYLGADLIWSFPTVNDNIVGGYDAIIFVHASHYAYTDYAWLEASPSAKLFHVSNEYNLGEPRTLWMACKEGRKYSVIANHPPEPSKIVMKYVNDWHQVNLNALIFGPQETPSDLFNMRDGCVYYGSFRKGRTKYFQKYLNGDIVTSTHQSNHAKFQSLGITPKFAKRVDWSDGGLGMFRGSLYIEDEVTHKHYNHLANRFYESINYGCVPVFDVSCQGTIEKSGYPVPDTLIIDGPKQIKGALETEIPAAWFDIAKQEKKSALETISGLVNE